MNCKVLNNEGLMKYGVDGMVTFRQAYLPYFLLYQYVKERSMNKNQ